MWIGNILTDTNFSESEIFNICNSFDTIDIKIPTLIIGWDFLKRLNINYEISILEKQICDNIFWTFSKKEKRYDHEEDLVKFKTKCLNELYDKNNMVHINPLVSSIGDVKNLIQLTTNGCGKYIYISNNSFVYIYNGIQTHTFNFNVTDYMGIGRNKIYRILYKNSNTLFFDNKIIKKHFSTFEEKIVPQLYKIITNGEK